MGPAPRDFPGFDPGDHDAFRPDKWVSNQFNMERRRTREKLELLARALTARIVEVAGGLEVAVGSEVPSLWNGHSVRDLWIHLLRPKSERDRLASSLDRGRSLRAVVSEPAPWRRHLHLGIGVGLASVEVGMVLPEGAWLDRDNVRAIWEDPEGRGALLDALAPLRSGGGWTLGIEPLRVVRRFARGDEVASAAFVGRAGDALLALAPLYRIVAWAEGNDRIGLVRRMGEDSLAVRAHEAEAEEARRQLAEDHRRRAEGATRRATDALGARTAVEEAFRRFSATPMAPAVVPPPPARPAEGDRRPGSERGPASARGRGPEGGRGGDGGRPAPRGPGRGDDGRRPADRVSDRRDGQGQGQGPGLGQGQGRRPQGPAPPEWKVGDKVLLKKGLLAGKVGEVKAVDGWTVRVILGALEVRVEARDLGPPVKET